MRSGLIFAVSSRIPNRYLLCRTISASARKMHRDGASTAQSINRCLQALHDAPAESPNGEPLPAGDGGVPTLE